MVWPHQQPRRVFHGDPLYYFVLPRTDVGGEESFPADGPAVRTFSDGAIQLQTHESSTPGIAAVIFDIAPDFTFRSASFNDAFWDLHRRLEGEGKIGHARENAPERRGLELQRWTPAEGWTTQHVAVR